MKQWGVYVVVFLAMLSLGVLLYTAIRLRPTNIPECGDERIQELEEDLAECMTEVRDYDSLTSELIEWKALAEQCVDRKTGIPVDMIE